MDTITVASDFDDETELKHYTLLEQLTEKYDSFIQIVNVQKDELEITSGEIAGKMKIAIAFTKLNHHFYTIENSNVEEGINTFLDSHPTDVLAMIAHKHTIFKRVFGAIHTKTMSHQTKIPLLVLQDK